MSKHKIPEGEDGQNPFAEMLHVMEIEQLIRFRKRLEMIGRKRMVAILTDEIIEREEIEKEQQAIEKAEHAAKKK